MFGRKKTPMIPTISSGVAGPLGVLHLPRFWSKVLMDAKGVLHEDYPACGAGFDQMVLDGLSAWIRMLRWRISATIRRPIHSFEAWGFGKREFLTKRQSMN